MITGNTYVAVYGTLRDGTGIQGTITGGKLIFPGHTYYPAWIRDGKSKKKTVVEIQTVSEEKLKTLDNYEGIASGFYKRSKVRVKLDNKEMLIETAKSFYIDAWIYEAGDLMMEKADKFTLVPEGNWNGKKAIQVRGENVNFHTAN